MVSKSTRGSRNKERATPSVAGRRQTENGASVNESERDIEIGVDATSVADAEIGTKSPTTTTPDTNTPKAKVRKLKTSLVWKHFTEIFYEETVDDMVIKKPMASCNYCDDVIAAPSRQGTTRLWNHYTAFHDPNKPARSASSMKKFRVDGSAHWMYDEETSLRKYYVAIIMHEYPFNFCDHEYTNDFIRSLRPNFPIMSRKTARTRIMDIFYSEKKKLYECFSSLRCRFSCTMDLWTSNQNKGYLCVTGHYIDDDRRIQKRIINFMHLEGRHTGANISAAFMRNMASWNLDRKLFALTLDNASSNDVCVDSVISILKNQGSIHCGGKFFHVRCAAHIINLIARDGVNTISSVIAHIRGLVLIVKSSPLQEEAFRKEVANLEIAERGLSLDVSTRWNSTYLMLADALHFKKAFQRLILLHPDKYGQRNPSSADWENAAILCNCLEIFYEATKVLSGSHYPTANLFFSEFSEINLKLMEWVNNPNDFIASMAKSMKEKFDKYWETSNVALAVACFLDPRYKMKVVEFYYTEMSDDFGFDDMYEFKKIVQKLFESYASSSAASTTRSLPQSQTRSARTSECYTDLNEEPKRKRLSVFLRDNTEVAGQDRDDYERYCNEPLLTWKEGDHFDILSWWKTHSVKYPILARVARDVLGISATTVASESAFSSGGRVVDKYRSRLDPHVVEALICSKDWIRAARMDENNVPSILDDLASFGADDIADEEGVHSDVGHQSDRIDVADN